MGKAKLALAAVPGLCSVTVGDPDLGLDAAEKIARHGGAAAVGDQMVDGGRRQQHPLPPVLALDPGRGLVRSHHRTGANLRGDRRCTRGERGLRAGQHLGDRALADADPEYLVEHPHQPFEANRLGDVQVQDEGRQIGAERRARRQTGGRRGTEPAAAFRADAAMPVDAGDDRANRRQLDMIVSMIAGLVLRPERVLAMRAMLGEGLDDPVRSGGQRPEDAGPALALLCRSALGAVGFAPLRGRHRGIVRSFGRAQPAFEFGDAPGQFRDLRRLGQHQRDQLIPG